MKPIKSFFACFSTYSRIPMPSVEFNTEDMEYVMVFFPFIGLVIGIIEYAIFYFCQYFGMPIFFRALIMSVIPLIITGGIHIDGYMDTMDAFSSYGDREKKLMIMKDPHIGAFAVIHLFVYEMIYLAFIYLLCDKSIIPFCLTFAFSRIMSGISTVTINGAKKEGMLHAITKNVQNKTVCIALIIEYIIVFFLLFRIDMLMAVIITAICIVGYLLYRRKMIKELDGITGDTSGFYLCLMEIILLIATSVRGII